MADVLRALYYGNCVTWPEDELESLMTMFYTEKAVAYTSILNNVDKEQFKAVTQALGYEKHHHIQKDNQVGLFTSKYRGHNAYFIRHSAIEHVFIRGIITERRRVPDAALMRQQFSESIKRNFTA